MPVIRHVTKDYQRTKLLDFNDFKPTIPVPGIFDEPTRCYQINVEWASIVMGMVSWLTEPDLWGDDKDERFIAIQEISKFLQGMQCMQFQLRQNPTNSCIIEQSTDGLTWSTAFDLSLCTSIIDNSSTVINNQNYSEYFNNAYQNIYNNFVNNYIDSPTNVYTNLAYGTGVDAELDAAYCNAVYTLVSVSADVAAQGVQELDNRQFELNNALAIAGAVLTIIAIAGAIPTGGASLIGLSGVAALWGTGIGIGAAIGNNLVNEWQNKTIAQYQDQAAQVDVTCYIVDNLPGSSNTQATMLSTLQSHTLTGNAAVIADNLAILLEADATYAAFLEKWDNNLEYANAGIALYCPCASTWIWVYTNTQCDYQFFGSLNIVNGQCGDGPGTFDGLYEFTGSGVPSTLTFTIDTLGRTVSQIRLVAAANTTGFTSSYINVSQGAFVDNRTLLANWNTYIYTPNENGIITIELNMTAVDFQGVGVREIQIDFA